MTTTMMTIVMMKTSLASVSSLAAMASQESAAEAAEQPRDQVSVSLTQKILLNALLGTCEASFTFEQLYTASVSDTGTLPR